VKNDDGLLECQDPNWTENSSSGYMNHYFRKSGPVGIEVGLDGYYWFVNNFGINFGLVLDIPFPNEFALNLDVQAGLAFQF
jgi:hypothetical protein